MSVSVYAETSKDILQGAENQRFCEGEGLQACCSTRKFSTNHQNAQTQTLQPHFSPTLLQKLSCKAQLKEAGAEEDAVRVD